MSAYVSTNKRNQTKKMVMISILSTISFIAMLLQIPLPIFPNFYQLDISDTIILIGGFILGPMAAIMMEAGKIILNILFHGTNTMFIGEIANFIIGCSFILPIILLYKKEANIKQLLSIFLLGIISITIIGALTNYFILLPLYANVYQLSLQSIIDIGQVINSNIHDLATFVVFMSIPFNLIKGILITIITLILYKKLTPILQAILHK